MCICYSYSASRTPPIRIMPTVLCIHHHQIIFCRRPAKAAVYTRRETTLIGYITLHVHHNARSIPHTANKEKRSASRHQYPAQKN